MEYHIFQAQFLLCRKVPISFVLNQFLQSLGSWAFWFSLYEISVVAEFPLMHCYKQLQTKQKARLNREPPESFPSLCEQKGVQVLSQGLFHRKAEEQLFGLQLNSEYIPTICSPLRK